MSDEATRYQESVHTPTEVANPEAYPPRLVKSYPGAPRHPLPWPPEKSAHRLGGLLAELGGITRSQWLTPLDMLPFTDSFEAIPDDDPLQWLVTRRPTPSGGARYSAEWYVIAGPDSEAPTGVHYYDPARHELVRLRSGDYLGRVASRPATTVLVHTSVFWRLAAKYGEMYYRLACLEAGIQVAQALVVGADEDATARLCFPDADLTELLGLDPRAEGVHAVVELVAPVPAAFEGPSLAAFPRALAAHASVLRQSRPAPQPLPSAPAGEAPAGEAPAGEVGRIALPHAAVDLRAGTRTRHAAMRGFKGETLPIGRLATILTAYGRQERWDLPANLVEFYCVIADVAGVPDGAYRYLPDEHCLELVSEGDPRRRLREAALAALTQQGARTANLWLLPVGDAEAAEERFGPRWYRVQQAAAGAALHRACLAAAAVDVAGRIQNDVLTHLLDAWFGLDGRKRSLLVAQLGTEHPAGLRPEFRLTW
ncbi:SagB-type dehydrogenase family enzyme [Streptomyces sp. 1114.5]|uniref:nitroreductase family protein n=1 Tax=Streptomyces sp. 1114.5 TaxID=1938830 RepID=UPI000EADBB94|nr:nitroreductase family protein [Streptomyces sp. 1114.5]RKT19886.1 SagB-type dehydrogenase family enzyme [Streptomyces sp. 1114.5]